MNTLPTTRCPLCGGANHCTPANSGTFDTGCWCATTPVSKEALARVPTHLINKACLCPRCSALPGCAPPPDTA